MKISFRTEKQKKPTANDGFNVVYAPAKRLAFKTRWYFLVALVLSPIVLFAWYIINQKVLITANGILTTDPIILVATEEGFIDSINVTPGEQVESDQTLVLVNSAMLLQEQVLLTKNHKRFLKHHQQGLDSIKSLYEEQIETYKKAELVQRLIGKEFKEYDDRGMLPLSDKLLIEQNNVIAEGRYTQSLIDYETAIVEHQNGDLAKTLLDIERALVQVEVKQQMLNIFSPKLAVINDVMVKEGQFVNKSDPIVSISNLAKPVVHVYLKPERMDYVKIGQTASITLPNGKTYEGVVNTPTQLSEKLPDVLSGPFKESKSAIKVTLDISPIPDMMLEGLPVKVRFHYSNNFSVFG